MILFIKGDSAREGPEERINEALPEWPSEARRACLEARLQLSGHKEAGPRETCRIIIWAQ